VFDQFLSKVEDEKLFRLGFEVEFYADDDSLSGNQVADLSELSVREAMEYFYEHDINIDKMYEWASDHEEELLREAGYTREEIEKEIIDDWFDDNPDWYQEYLEEEGEWDDEEEEPAEDATDEGTAREEVELDIRNGRKVWSRYDNFDSKINDRISEIFDNVDIAQAWWEDNRWELMRENNWELSDEYRHDEVDEDIIREYGGGLEGIANDLNDVVDGYVSSDEGGYSSSTENWVVKPDGSLSENGVEIASPIFPFFAGIEEMEKVFDWIDRNRYYTDESTGLHVSMSFTEEKAFDDIDWVKVALLSGEEYMLQLFNRSTNQYTTSQLKNMQVAAKKGKLGDLNSMRSFQELKDKFADGIATGEKYSSFNLSDYGSGGRVEWRIIGGHQYHQLFNTVKDNVLKMAFAMYIGSEPELFKEQYLRSLGRLLSRVTATKDDPLKSKSELLYGNDEEAAILSRNPLYKYAVQLLKSDKSMMTAYKNVTLAGERMRDEDANAKQRFEFTKAMGVFAMLVSKVEATEYTKKLFPYLQEEAYTENLTVQRIRKVARRTANHYGYTGADFKDDLHVDPVTALATHYPIADHISGLNLLTRAAVLFADMDDTHQQRKMEFMKYVPGLRKFTAQSTTELILAIALSTKKDQQEPMAGSISDAIVSSVESNNLDEKNLQFIKQLMDDIGVDAQDVMTNTNYDRKKEVIRQVLGYDIEKVAVTADNALQAISPELIPEVSLAKIITGLQHNDADEQSVAASLAALWIGRISDKLERGIFISSRAVKGLKIFIVTYNLIQRWNEAGIFDAPIAKKVMKVLDFVDPELAITVSLSRIKARLGPEQPVFQTPPSNPVANVTAWTPEVAARGTENP